MFINIFTLVKVPSRVYQEISPPQVAAVPILHSCQLHKSGKILKNPSLIFHPWIFLDNYLQDYLWAKSLNCNADFLQPHRELCDFLLRDVMT